MSGVEGCPKGGNVGGEYSLTPTVHIACHQ